MHNKKYALKLVQEKLNNENNYSYSQIGKLTVYSKLQILNFSTLILDIFIAKKIAVISIPEFNIWMNGLE